MASWTETIGAADESTNVLQWRDEVGPIDSALVSGGGTGVLLTDLAVSKVDLHAHVETVAGIDELTTAWEGFASAVIITAGNLSLTISGPTHPSAQMSDSTEPYRWNPSATQVSEIEDFVDAYKLLTQVQKDATTVTLRDSLPEPELTISRDQTSVVEGTDATWTITADTAPSSDLTVNVDVTESGSYIDGTAPTTVTILSGNTTATLTVPTLDDSADEPNGSITATLETGTGYTLGSTIAATITVTDDDDPDLMPTLPAIANQTAQVGTAFSLTFTAASGGDPPLAYSVSGEPSWLSLSDLTLSGTPNATGTHTVTITVEDDDGDTDTASFDIVVSAALAVITIDSVANQTGEVVRALVTIDTPTSWYNRRGGSTDGSVSGDSDLDIDDDTTLDRLRYQAGSNRVFFNMTPSNGVTIFGSGGEGENAECRIETPYGSVLSTAVTSGNTNVRFGVTPADEAILNQLQSGDLVNLVVSGFVAADLIPDFGSGDIADQTYTQNTAISALQLPAATGGDTPLAYSISGQPSGLTLNNSRQLVGTPTATGTFSTTFTVTDDDGDTDTIDFVITINAPADLIPTFGSGDIADQTYTQNTAISALQLPAATGGDGTLAYSITGQPAGLTLNASRQLVGTPTATGTFNTTFTVTDADGDTDTISFTITVNAADLMPSLPAIADQAATVGTAFSLTFSAATSGDPPLAYSVSGEPSWMSLVNRTLSGTPDAAATSTVTVTVTDDDGDTDTSGFDIVVSAQDLIPTLPAIADQTATVGIAFSLTFSAATGGDGALAYTASGNPSWLALSGRTLSGTPTATGTHTITVTVTDDDGDTDTASFDLVVSSAAVPQITIAADQASVVEGTNVTFTVTATIAPSANLNVHIVVTEMGDVIDVTPPASVQILSGATTATLTVTTEDDAVDEVNGSVTATIQTGTGYTVGSASAATTTVTDNDDPPVVVTLELTIARDLSTVVEGTDATWTVTADVAPESNLTINVAVTQSGSYIDGTPPSTVTLSSGDTTATLTVPTDDDSTDETDGSITATLETGTGYTLGSAVAATIAVTDDDASAGISATTRLDAFSLSGRQPTYAIEIQHPDVFDNIRVIADTQDATIEGNIYTALAFRARLPQQREGEVLAASVEVDNIGREMTQWVEASGGGRGATMRVMEVGFDIGGDAEIVWEVSGLDVGQAQLTNESFSISLTDISAAQSNAVKLRHDASESPGLF